MGMGAPQIEGRGVWMRLGTPKEEVGGWWRGAGWGWGRRDGDGGSYVRLGAPQIQCRGVWMGVGGLRWGWGPPN